MVVDVSDQSGASDGLADVVERYRLLVEMSPDMIVVHQDGVVRYMNPVGVGLLGFESASEVVGRPVLDFVSPDSVPGLVERLAMLGTPGAVSPPTELGIVAKDGTTVVLESRSVHTVWAGQRAHQVFLHDTSDARKADAALRYQASVLSSVSDAIVSINQAGRVQSWNPAAERLYGTSSAMAIGRPLAELIGRRAVDATGRPRSGERQHHRPDGATVAVHVAIAPVLDPDGATNGHVAICTDLSERRRAAAASAAAEARFAAVVATLHEGVVLVEIDGTVSAENAAARAILGCEPGAIVATLTESNVVVADGRRLGAEEHPLRAALRTGTGQRDFVLGFDHPAGQRRWLSLNCQILESRPDRLERAVVCSFTDITQRRDSDARLSYEASHDSLTGLANRRVLLAHLHTAMRTLEAHPVAIIFVDLNRFKSVNDIHGHHAGDEVIKHLGSRLQRAIADRGLIARLAGDEFVIATTGLDGAEVVRLAHSLQALVTNPISLADTRTIVVDASVGVALATVESTPETLLGDADIAMYRAKKRGGGAIEVFSDALRSQVLRRHDLSDRLREALKEHLVDVHFQPVVNLREGTVEAVEALARWTDRDLGPIPPIEFVSIAEEHGLIDELGRQVLYRACRAATEGQVARHAIGVAVNLSARQLCDPTFVDIVQRVLEDTGLDPHRLSFEVTESVLMDDVDNSLAVLTELHALGVGFALDDFGTGYSSLSYLRRIPVDTLKIDQSFTAGIGTPENDAIITAIVGLAHTLGHRVIAEGVESVEQLDWLRDSRCDAAQGYLLGRPEPLGLLRDRLHRNGTQWTVNSRAARFRSEKIASSRRGNNG
jgi:diguanylate cyclase (GGDEF)-like protein/PAS domain S-box-containing protein